MINQIYLAGTISGIEWEQAIGWRDKLSENIYHVTSHKWRCFNPCDHFNEFGEVITDNEGMTYDLDHLRHSRLVIASFEYGQNSIGTLIELGVAYENRIPVIGYNPKQIKLHPWIKSICTHICSSEDGLYQYLCDHHLNEG